MTDHALMQPQPRTHETAASAAAAQVKALVEARYTIAIARPRDMDAVREALLKECRRPSFAEVARYNKPIGKGVTGPSIRFAEAAIRCMKNIVVDETTTYDDDEKRIIQVSVTDLETNVPYTTSVTVEKTVERRNKKADDEVLRERTNSTGNKVYILRATEDDILNKKNALLSKAIRTIALRLIPGDLVDECMDLVVKTQKDRDKADPDAARRKLVDAFSALNVSVEDLKAYLGTDLAKLSPAELADLRALHAAIKDGEATWRSAMEAKAGTKAADPKASANRFAGGAPAATTSAPAQPQQQADPSATQTPRQRVNALMVEAGQLGVGDDAAAVVKKHGEPSKMDDGALKILAEDLAGVVRNALEG